MGVEQALMSHLSLKSTISDRSAVVEKALKALTEIDSCSKKAENASRVIRTLLGY